MISYMMTTTTCFLAMIMVASGASYVSHAPSSEQQAPTTTSSVVCQCDANTYTCIEGDPVSQGEKMFLCISSVENHPIEGMLQDITLTQQQGKKIAAITMPLVLEGRPQGVLTRIIYPSGKNSNLAVIQTQLKSKFFLDKNPEPLVAHVSLSATDNVSITIPVHRRSATEVFEKVDSTYDVKSCQCDPTTYTCREEILTIGSSLFLCVFTPNNASSSAIQISAIEEVELFQQQEQESDRGTTQISVFAVKNSSEDALTSVVLHPQGRRKMAIIQMQLRSAFFEQKYPKNLYVRGKCSIAFLNNNDDDTKAATKLRNSGSNKQQDEEKHNLFEIQMSLAPSHLDEVPQHDTTMVKPPGSPLQFLPSRKPSGRPTMLLRASSQPPIRASNSSTSFVLIDATITLTVLIAIIVIAIVIVALTKKQMKVLIIL